MLKDGIAISWSQTPNLLTQTLYIAQKSHKPHKEGEERASLASKRYSLGGRRGATRREVREYVYLYPKTST